MSRSSALSEEELSPDPPPARHALPGRRALRLDERRAERRASRSGSTRRRLPSEIAEIVAEKLTMVGLARHRSARCRRSSRAACASASRSPARSRSSPRSSSTTSPRRASIPLTSEKIAQLIVDINAPAPDDLGRRHARHRHGPHGRRPSGLPPPGALPVHRHLRRGRPRRPPGPDGILPLHGLPVRHRRLPAPCRKET